MAIVSITIATITIINKKHVLPMLLEDFIVNYHGVFGIWVCFSKWDYLNNATGCILHEFYILFFCKLISLKAESFGEAAI